MKPRQIKAENPPLYFVPTCIMCSCGQKVMITDSYEYKTDLPNIKVMCTNPLCSQNQMEKKIDITKFGFTDYEIVD